MERLWRAAHTGLLLVIWSAATVTLAGGGGCGGPCGKMVDMQLECGPDKSVGEEEASNLCKSEFEKDKPNDAWMDAKSCSETHEECKAYRACLRDREMDRRIQEISSALSAEKVDDALNGCDKSKLRMGDYPELKNVCTRAIKEAIQVASSKDRLGDVSLVCSRDLVEGDEELQTKCAETFEALLAIAAGERRGMAKWALLTKHCASQSVGTKFSDVCNKLALAAMKKVSAKESPQTVASMCKIPWIKRQSKLEQPCIDKYKKSLEFAAKDKVTLLVAACKDKSATKQAKDACAEVMKGENKRLVALVSAIRDGKEPDKQLYGKCGDLKALAKVLGAEAGAGAEALCAEAKLAGEVGKAMAKVDAELKKERKSFLLDCGRMLDKLDKAPPTAWTKQARQRVVHGCFDKLATAVLAAELPEMTICKFQVKKLLETVEKYRISTPSLSPKVAEAKAKCAGPPPDGGGEDGGDGAGDDGAGDDGAEGEAPKPPAKPEPAKPEPAKPTP